jgi:ABC-type multidrug transport system permease subunit
VAQTVPLKELDDSGFFINDTREMGEAFEPEDGKDALGITVTRRPARGGDNSAHYDAKPPGTITQVSMLFTREVTNLKRDVTALGARFGLTIFLSVLIGTIFLKVGEEDRGVFLNAQSSFGALIMVALMSMFGTAQPALLAFPDERPVFLREYSTNHYNVVSYFLSRLTMEAFITAIQVLVSVTISYLMIGFKSNYGILYGSVYALAMASTALAVLLGCSVEDPKLAQEMLPILFVPQMLFAGFFVPPSLIPTWLRWARYLCTLTYSVRILLVAEFEECAKSEPNCKAVMENVQAKSDETWWNWLVLIGLFLVFRLLALKTLRSKATKFF